MNTIIPAIIISLKVGLFQLTATVYEEAFIVIETNPNPGLAEVSFISPSLALVDIENNTITWFSGDLALAYRESFSEREIQPGNWKAMIERSNSKIEIIEQVVTSDGTFLKVKFSEEWVGGNCSPIHEQFYLLYNETGTVIPSTVVPFCKLPEHNLDLPPAYKNYRYIFRQWTELKEDNGLINEYSVINTTITTDSLGSSYSIEDLLAVPLVSKESFDSRTQ